MIRWRPFVYEEASRLVSFRSLLPVSSLYFWFLFFFFTPVFLQKVHFDSAFIFLSSLPAESDLSGRLSPPDEIGFFFPLTFHGLAFFNVSRFSILCWPLFIRVSGRCHKSCTRLFVCFSKPRFSLPKPFVIFCIFHYVTSFPCAFLAAPVLF